MWGCWPGGRRPCAGGRLQVRGTCHKVKNNFHEDVEGRLSGWFANLLCNIFGVKYSGRAIGLEAIYGQNMSISWSQKGKRRRTFTEHSIWTSLTLNYCLVSAMNESMNMTIPYSGIIMWLALSFPVHLSRMVTFLLLTNFPSHMNFFSSSYSSRHPRHSHHSHFVFFRWTKDDTDGCEW